MKGRVNLTEDLLMLRAQVTKDKTMVISRMFLEISPSSPKIVAIQLRTVEAQ